MTSYKNAPGRQLIVALPTLFSQDGELDVASIAAVCELVAGSLADGAFVAGTTGEFLALERHERRALVEAALQSLGDKRLVAHIGSPSVRQSLAAARDAADLGVTKFALLTPLYLPASPDATVRFFDQVARSLPDGSRLYAYVFRDRTNTAVSPQTLRRIADAAPLVGIKVSGEPLEACRQYKETMGAEFEVLTGSDGDYARVAEAGLTGVVSGVASCVPEIFDAMKRALSAEQVDVVEAADRAVQEAVSVIDGDIGRIKTALALRGIGTATTRMATDVVTDATRESLRRVIERATAGEA